VIDFVNSCAKSHQQMCMISCYGETENFQCLYILSILQFYNWLLLVFYSNMFIVD